MLKKEGEMSIFYPHNFYLCPVLPIKRTNIRTMQLSTIGYTYPN